MLYVKPLTSTLWSTRPYTDSRCEPRMPRHHAQDPKDRLHAKSRG